MLRIDQLRLTPGQSESVLTTKIAKLLRIGAGDILRTEILRRAVDAREELFFVYTVAAEVKQEAAVLRRCRDKRVSRYTPEEYRLPAPRLTARLQSDLTRPAGRRSAADRRPRSQGRERDRGGGHHRTRLRARGAKAARLGRKCEGPAVNAPFFAVKIDDFRLKTLAERENFSPLPK